MPLVLLWTDRRFTTIKIKSLACKDMDCLLESRNTHSNFRNSFYRFKSLHRIFDVENEILTTHMQRYRIRKVHSFQGAGRKAETSDK